MFIVGCPRSGTTWMALLLAQHPEIQACQQIGAISSLHKFYLYWRRGETHTRYHCSVIRFPDGDLASGGKPVYEPLMSRETMLGIGRTMLDQVYGQAEAKHPGAKVIAISMPENALTAELMVELMPDAYFLHLIRDPRAVFVSQRRGTEDFGARFPTDPYNCALSWNNYVTKARKLVALSPHYREVRYETLKQNGAAELRGILEWLGVTADPAWCERITAATTVQKLQGTPGTPKNFFRAGKAEGWRKEMKSRELQTVEYFARDLMLELGYEPVHPRSHRKPARVAVREALGRIRAMAQAVVG
ncbi:MAG: sulfotransferase family protein [Gemmatimonadales bacterium]